MVCGTHKVNIILWIFLALNPGNESCKNVLLQAPLYQNEVTFYSMFGSKLERLCCVSPLPCRASMLSDSYICKMCIEHRSSPGPVAFVISSGPWWSIQEAAETLIDLTGLTQA